MLQIGTKNVFLYLPENEPGIEKLEGEYEQKLKRWRFSLDKKDAVQKFVEDRYPDLFDSDFEQSDSEYDESDEEGIEIDQRLHRAKSFSGYDSDERSSDEDDSSDDDRKKRSRSRSHKFKDGCDRYRPKLTNKQFLKKRSNIKNRF